MGNSIGEIGAKSIAITLEKLTTLTELSLNIGYNGIGENGVKSIGLALEKLT